jgi:hypothetical protein
MINIGFKIKTTNNQIIGIIFSVSGSVPWTILYFGARVINYINTEAKCCHLKKLTCKGTLRPVFICLRPLPFYVFIWGGLANFVVSESGQIQSVKLLQNMVSNRTQHPPPLPWATHCLYTLYFDTWNWGGGESWTREKVATVHKAGSK